MAKKKKAAKKQARAKKPAEKTARKSATGPRMKKLTPVLFVDSVEKSVPFWTSLGFKIAVSVPEGSATGFAILVKDDTEVMYQSRASVAKDLPALASMASSVTLYVEVTDVDAVEHALGNSVEVALPRRKTFYGATEIGFREPGGNVVIFAEQKS